MLTCLVDTTTQATSDREALDRLAVLKGLKDVPVTYAERLRDGAIRSQVFGRSAKLHAALNELLRKRGVPAVSFEEWRESASKADDEVSF